MSIGIAVLKMLNSWKSVENLYIKQQDVFKKKQDHKDVFFMLTEYLMPQSNTETLTMYVVCVLYGVHLVLRLV